jgi:UDP-2-acetamido-3-amino-2,3-dideoxy-glucuronate N-acetyltransferase
MLNKQLALIGAGYWGKNLARNFHSLGVLHTICDASSATLDTYGSDYAGVQKTTDPNTLFANPVIKQIAIAAPAVLHYQLVKNALSAGKDIFVEKPLCLDTDQAEELVKLADVQGRILMVGHLLQYHPCIQRLQTLVGQGELGKLHYITSNRLNLGKIRREENALWSFAPHDISVILSVIANQLPEQVRCTGEAYLSTGVADTTLTQMRFAGGVRAHIYVSWLNPFKEQKLTVVGSHGMAVFDDTRPWPEKLSLHRHYITWQGGQIPTPNKSNGEHVVVPEAEPLRQECQHFLDCCCERLTPRTDGQEGLRVLRVLKAAQASLETDGEATSPSIPHRAPSIEQRAPSLTSTSPQAARSPLPAPSSVLEAPSYFVHPTAIVDDGAEIGEGTKIWHFCHVMKGAKIGKKCVFGQNVNVDGGTIIGNNVKVQNNVSIYTGIEIEDDVFLGPSCVLTNVTNPRSQVNRHSLYEKTVIKRGATIGANATIVCGVTIGRYAFIGAGAVVTKDVPDYALMLGNPARQKGWMSRHGHILKNPDKAGIMVCPESGYRYQLNGAELRAESTEQKPAISAQGPLVSDSKPSAPHSPLPAPSPTLGALRCLDLDENAPLPSELSKGTKLYDDFKLWS